MGCCGMRSRTAPTSVPYDSTADSTLESAVDSTLESALPLSLRHVCFLPPPSAVTSPFFFRESAVDSRRAAIAPPSRTCTATGIGTNDTNTRACSALPVVLKRFCHRLVVWRSFFRVGVAPPCQAHAGIERVPPPLPSPSPPSCRGKKGVVDKGHSSVRIGHARRALPCGSLRAAFRILQAPISFLNRSILPLFFPSLSCVLIGSSKRCPLAKAAIRC